MKSEVLQKYLRIGRPEDLASICGLDWRIEKSQSNVAIAYNLADGVAAEQRLAERLASHKPGLLILNRLPSFKMDVPLWVIKDGSWIEFLKEACDHYFPLPRNLKLLGVTGTNGKTTTADLVLQLGEMAGLKGISIGTLGVRQTGKTLEEFGLTTPGQIQLREILFRYGSNCNFAVMEVSSHALAQGRVQGLVFESAAWTSFTQDHLDYHKTMESYFEAKEKIIHYLSHSGHLYVPPTQTWLKERLSRHKNLRVINHITANMESSLPAFFQSHFNRDNLNCAIDMVSHIGVDVAKLKLTNLVPPPGRFYIREWNNRVAVVDFAHTPDALENILKSLKDSFPSKRITVVFGCGGDRDKTKRPQMGAVACKYADKIILTSDNPRTENPDQIIQDIIEGIEEKSNLICVTDRPTAVKRALEELADDEVLLLAGKGHEDYIIKGTQKVHYSDIEELDNFVRLIKG